MLTHKSLTHTQLTHTHTQKKLTHTQVQVTHTQTLTHTHTRTHTQTHTHTHTTWQAWHLATSTFTLCGKRSAWRHRPSLCVTGVCHLAPPTFSLCGRPSLCVAGVERGTWPQSLLHSQATLSHATLSICPPLNFRILFQTHSLNLLTHTTFSHRTLTRSVFHHLLSPSCLSDPVFAFLLRLIGRS